MDSPIQPIQYSTLEVDDFSGGITDNYIGGAINKYRVADNLVLEKYGDKARFRLRAGMTYFNTAYPQFSISSASDGELKAVKYFDGTPLFWVQGKVAYVNSASNWTDLTIIQNSAGTTLPTWASPDDRRIAISALHDHIIFASDPNGSTAGAGTSVLFKLYKNSANSLQIRRAGLMSPLEMLNFNTGNLPVVAAYSAGANNFLYRFCWRYDYYVGEVQYIDRGSLYEFALASSSAPSTAAPAALTKLAGISVGSWDVGFDYPNLKYEIYRTVNNGVNFYLNQTVTFGTTSAQDTMTDSVLVTKEPLYTEGGRVENDSLHGVEVLHICEDTATAYYAREEHFPDQTHTTNIIRQSIPGDFDSCPADFTLEISDSVKGISSMQDRPIVFGGQNTYRIDGAFDDLGRGGMVAQKISDRADCVSQQSIVQTLLGVFWCGSDNFYWTNGYSVLAINKEWTMTHRSFTASRSSRILGKYDRAHNRVWWTVVSQGSTSNDKCFILDLNFSDPNQDKWCFTSASFTGGTCPTAFEFVGDTMYSGDSSAYMYRHNENLAEDSRTSGGVSIKRPIMYTYESVSFNGGISQTRKVAPWFTLKFKHQQNTAGGDLSFTTSIQSVNDQGRVTDSLRPILYGTIGRSGRGINTAGGLVHEKRRFPSSSWRFNDKQIILSNPYAILDDSGWVSKVSANKTAATLSLSAGFTFLSNLVSTQTYVSFSADNFTKDYPIIAMNTSLDTITISDTANDMPSSTSGTTFDWVMRGYPTENMYFGLISYSIQWAPLGQTQRVYRREDLASI